MDSRKLFEYSQVLRNRYLEQIAELPWEEVIRNRGGSFDSLRNIFLHTVDAEDMLVNYLLSGRAKDWVAPNPDEFHSMDSIRKRAQDVQSRTKAYVAKLKLDELERKLDLPRKEKPSTSARVEDILAHAALENIHHFGELIALLWQMDMEPPHLGWIDYLKR